MVLTAESNDGPLRQPAKPTKVGQRVRTVGHNRQVALWMETGTVVRFTRAGNAVIEVDSLKGNRGRTITDYDSCFRVIDAAGRWVRG